MEPEEKSKKPFASTPTPLIEKLKSLGDEGMALNLPCLAISPTYTQGVPLEVMITERSQAS
jgi:hypothetical protein